MQAVVWVFLPLVVAYATALRWCVERWGAPTQYFEHCYLVPLVMALVLWWRRAEWRRRPAAPDAGGLWLLVPALVLHLAAALLTIDSMSAASLVLAVPGAAWLALGRARLRGQWPVLWFTAFAVPLPIYVEGRLAFELKELAIQGGLWLGNCLGADFVRTASDLRPRGGAEGLHVADACGGLRSLLALVTLGYCVAFFLGSGQWLRRLVLLLLAGPLAMAANLLRIAGLCVVARHFGLSFAQGLGHDLLNAAEWLFAVGVLLLVDFAVSRRAPAVREFVPVVLPVRTTRLRPIGVGLWLMAVVLLGLSLYRPVVDVAGRAQRLPADLAGFVRQVRSPDEEREFQRHLPRWTELLGTADFVHETYRDPEGGIVFVTALFHGANWKSVHPPRICLEGSNMHITMDGLAPLAIDGVPAQVGRIETSMPVPGVNAATARPYVSWYAYGTRELLTGSYAEFVGHHWPRALLRSSNAGFLLRVESFADGPGGMAAADARCRELLGALVVAARGLLP